MPKDYKKGGIVKRWAVLLLLAVNCEAFATSIEVQAARNGMFYVDGFVGNVPTRFLIDTGASGFFVPRTIANKAGEFGECTWKTYSTANGVVDHCSRRISSITVGPFVLRNIEAQIGTDESTQTPLLGYSMLRHFRIVIHRGRMTLTYDP